MKVFRNFFLFAGVVLIFILSWSAVAKEDKGLEGYMEAHLKLKPEYLRLESSWKDSVLASLSLEEQIAQMVMMPVYPNQGNAHKQQIIESIKEHKIGGLIFFKGDPNITAQWINEFQATSTIPLFIAIDGEWGVAMRIDSVLSFPKQMTLGAIQDNQLIYNMGVEIARQCALMGININFAPVVDVNNNARNPVINARSFGEDRENVARKGIAYMMGMQDNKILTTAKHFPGHGDTESDSHHSLPVIKHSYNRLDSIELYPFKKLINAGLSGMMIAHLSIPALDSTPNQASTLSKPIVTGILKDELDFQGLIFTDALNMKGVSDYYKPGEIEVKAVMAGNDILLMPEDEEKSISKVSKAVENGEIEAAQIRQTAEKILAAKYWMGLHHVKPNMPSELTKQLNSTTSKLLIRDLARNSITLAKNNNRLLPLHQLDTLKIASIAFGKGKKTEFQQRLHDYTDVKAFSYGSSMSDADWQALLSAIRDRNLLIISVENTSMFASRNFGISHDVVKYVDALIHKKPAVVDIFANPYALGMFKNIHEAEAVIVSYEIGYDFKDLSAQMIFGADPFRGKLPVTVNEHFTYGMGEESYDRKRLGYAFPEELNINPFFLDSIDRLVQWAIDEKATPGCQVLAVKDDKIFFHKAYGHTTYIKNEPVTTSQLYDLASITKIAGTLPLLMHLYEEGKIDLKDNLGVYLPFLDTTDKRDLSMGEILTHQSGLYPWIPFYISTLEGLIPGMDMFSNRQSEDYPFKLDTRMYMLKHIGYRENAFSNQQDDIHNLKVTENLYLNYCYKDTIMRKIAESKLQEKQYKYSDLGYYYFQVIIEEMMGSRLDSLAYDMFYKPLGAATLGYLPLNRFEKKEIVPTENDLLFRHQLLRGHVHDPGAAMMGGVAGHAGLFSNANDLAKLMAMYLNKGSYGGTRYFDEKTIEVFTSSPYIKSGNRRAYGFDKPKLPNHKFGPAAESVSKNSFGHSGFTGTLAWADPDYNMIYIFLSNRIHPDASNNKLIELDIRTKVQDLLYKAVQVQERDSW